MDDNDFLLFIYGTLMSEMAAHAVLEGATPRGPARTPPSYRLVDCGAYPAMVAGGTLSVIGELYAMNHVTLARVDLHEQHPVLFQRTMIALEGGVPAFAYLLRSDQVIGRRPIRTGDYRAHLGPPPKSPRRPWYR